MTVRYSKTALKGLRRLDRKSAEKLIAKIAAYAAAPTGEHPYAKPLTGIGGLRIRQGDYRAICKIENGEPVVLAVIKIGDRKEVYR